MMILKIRILLLRLYFNSFALLNKDKSAEKLIQLFSTPQARVSRKKELEILQSARNEVLDFDQKKVKLYEWGEGDKYVLLFHGWESNAGSLGAYVYPLVEEGYKVIAYDSLAHGNSEGKQANMIIFKEIAKRIINEYGCPEIAIGHSLGANVIVLLSAEENLNIPKVVLISPFNQMKAIFLGFKAILKIPNSIYSIMVDKVSERFNYNIRELEFGKVGQESPLKSVLIMHDKDDKITPFSHSSNMSKRWQLAQLIEIEGSGHYKILWNQNAIDTALHFIGKKTNANN